MGFDHGDLMACARKHGCAHKAIVTAPDNNYPHLLKRYRLLDNL
jgi:hypothetical protein